MIRTSRPHRLLALAVVLPVLAFGACGGGDDAASSKGAATKSTTTTAMSATDGGDAGAAPATGNAVKIADFSFKPNELKVAVGTKVTFTNDDSYEHTATANDGTFDSGKLAKGDTFDFTFDKAGTYAFKCAIHNSMTGKVVVE
jgi:plastocyanin